MYPFERYMKKLKSYCKNRARPEGCMSECYIADECVRFCSRKLEQLTDMGDQEHRDNNIHNETMLEGEPISPVYTKMLSDDMLEKAYRCILFNLKIVEPYLE
ncbi:hypothetical protein Syun_029309 [Stephania yunnanensis]|uniref:DUF4218 domain-containing protein n=1 Tax=Stephania yunnanensis TaxID=152371 RepID=A0AAP0E7Q8_9MAGN